MKPINEQAYEDYQNGMKYRDIADKYNVSINTVKSWRKRHGWQKKGAHKNDRVHTKKGAPFGNKNAEGAGAPSGNKNAAGNSGGAPSNNRNAATHSLYAKYLPVETLEIFQALEAKSPIDTLWDNIRLLYSKILFAQQRLHVAADDKGDRIVSMDGSETTGYKAILPFEKEVSGLSALSRAMGTLNNMIKQYEELKPEGEAALRAAKLKAEIHNLTADENDDDTVEIVITKKEDADENKQRS